MKIYVNGQLDTVSLEKSDVKKDKEIVNQMLAKGLLLERVEMGSQTYYEDVFKHIDAAYQDNKQITIFFRDLKTHLKDVMFTTHEYLERAIPQVESLGESFYGKEEAMQWEQLSDFIEGLEFVKDVVSAMHSEKYIEENSSGYFDLKSINTHIAELTHAIQVKDYILIGDLIMYEFKPLYESIYNHIDRQMRGGQ